MLKEQLEKMDVKMEEERKKESDEMVQRDDAATKRFSMWIKGEKWISYSRFDGSTKLNGEHLLVCRDDRMLCLVSAFSLLSSITILQ